MLEALRSGWISSVGAFIERFEQEFAQLCRVRHCVALANGTVALHLALVTARVGSGDEVIVPDLTFVATAAAVVHAGATPVLVDVDPRTMCLDPALVERAITPRTRAIIAVHLFGHPAEMDALREIAERRGLFLLEDAAEAHGARLGGRTVGGLGDAATFSFYGNKLLTTGEGGCITTNDEEFAKRARFLKDHAMSPQRRYYHPEVGFNFRMTNLQAALGCAQLQRFPELLSRKQAVLAQYRAALRDSDIVLNPETPGVQPVCWLAVALLPGDWPPARKGALMQRLRAHGIDTRPFFVPLHELPPYVDCRLVDGGYSSIALSRRGLCLPSSNRLSDEDVARVARELRDALAEV